MELQEILDSVPFHELLQTIQKKARTGNKEVSSYIRGILQGYSDVSDESEKRRFETFKCALSILQITDVSNSLVSDIVSNLLIKIDTFHTSYLVKLAEFLIDYAKTASDSNSKWLEILAKVLSCLYVRDTIVHQGADMSGKELRKDILSSLLSENLDIPIMIQLTSVLKDIELSDDELKLVSEKLLQLLPTVELNNLPSFVYQLLLFSSKGNRQQIFQNVSSYFIKKDDELIHKSDDERNSEDLIDNDDEVVYRQTEGTVILMISDSSKHDQTICKEFCALLKKIQHQTGIMFLPFIFACSLSLSKSVSGKDEIFDVLKKSLLSAYDLKKKKKISHWLREMVPNNVDMLALIKETIKCGRYGWDHICQGLVKFGFSVIDTFGPRYVLGGTAVKTDSEEGCALGSHILRDTFKNYRIVRLEILDQILNRIITKSQKPVKHYIDILSQIVQSDPLFLLEILPKLVEILDFIHLVPHSNAIDILSALAPLLRISAPLKDTLMLVLRKALFHRDVSARKVAVSGYLMILKKLTSIGRVSLSQSQTSFSSQASSASMISTQVKADVYVSAGNPTSKTMCLEIMGLLKRILMQQGTVRQLLYENLYDVTLQNKSLKDIVLELLLGQIEKYYDKSDGATLPLHFNLCLQDQQGTLILEEPLAHLLCVIHLILYEAGDVSEIDEEDYDQSAQKMLYDLFQNLLKKLPDVDVTDLNVNAKDPDESNSTSLKSSLILNCYETLMEYSLMLNKEYDSELCEEFVKLFDKYNEILQLLNTKKQKKPKAKIVNVTSPMHVTIRFFARALEGIFTDGIFKHQDGLNVLRNNSAFVLYIVTVCNQKLSKSADTGFIDNFSNALPNYFSYLSSIAKVYFKVYMEGLNSDFPKAHYPTLELEKLPLTFAEGLASIFTYVTSFKLKNAGKFIVNLCNQDSLSSSQGIKFVLKSIQKTIVKLLADTENDISVKEIVPLLSIIKTLYDSFSNEFTSDIYKWLKQLCSQQTFQNLSISKSVIFLSLSLAHHQSTDLTFFQEVAFDIHYNMEDIDPDENVVGSPKFSIITQEVARNIVPNLIYNLDLVMDEIECLINYTKANTSIPPELISVVKDADKFTLEQGLCSRLSDFILVLHEMVQTSVPPDNVANNVLKLVARFYKSLSSLAKYYLMLHTKSKSVQLHSAFEKLVKLSHTKLTTFVYSFITYLQVVSEGDSGAKKKANSAATSKAMREIKTIPTLVFAIESYEKELILLSKKFNKSLVNHMKLSTARDFRINASAIASVLQQQDESTMSSIASSHHETVNQSEVEAEANEQSDEHVTNDIEESHQNQSNDESVHNESDSSVQNEQMEEETNNSSAVNRNASLRPKQNVAKKDKPRKALRRNVSLSLSRHATNNDKSTLDASKTSKVSGVKRKPEEPIEEEEANDSSFGRGKTPLQPNQNAKKDKPKSHLKRDTSLRSSRKDNNNEESTLDANKNSKVLGVKRKRLGVRATAKRLE
ncbi:Fanconi anemia group I protein [Parasteatoda tepidariorum]|nr:Fanconi anemia group I protein-like [Parasteatoda tepidariorum]